jgi:hypothetical protein
MSLNYNLTKIKNHDTVCFRIDSDGEERMRPVTNLLIWSTMSVDLGEITAKNVDEWLFRLKAIGLIYQEESQLKVTREQLVAHIGLTTNVFPNKTRAQFLKNCAERISRRASDLVRYAKPDAQEVA